MLLKVLSDYKIVQALQETHGPVLGDRHAKFKANKCCHDRSKYQVAGKQRKEEINVLLLVEGEVRVSMFRKDFIDMSISKREADVSL